MKSNKDPEANPWVTLESKIVYKNPWFSVREDQVLRPDGSPGTYSVVEPKIVTGIVPIDDQLNTWLVGQYRYPINLYSWEIVEGGAEIGEDPKNAAIRELKEEAGLLAGDVIQLGDPFHLSNCFTNEVAVVFLARDISVSVAQPEVTEVLQLKKLPFAEVIDMVRKGIITDAVSIIALERACVFLESGR